MRHDLASALEGRDSHFLVARVKQPIRRDDRVVFGVSGGDGDVSAGEWCGECDHGGGVVSGRYVQGRHPVEAEISV